MNKIGKFNAHAKLGVFRCLQVLMIWNDWVEEWENVPGSTCIAIIFVLDERKYKRQDGEDMWICRE